MNILLKPTFFFFILTFSTLSFGQRKSELKHSIMLQKIEIGKLRTQLEGLKLEVEKLRNSNFKEIDALKRDLALLKKSKLNNSSSPNVEVAIGEGSIDNSEMTQNYNNQSNKNSVNSEVKSNYGYTPSTGVKIHTGPKGGRYYYNSKGNKVYVKRN